MQKTDSPLSSAVPIFQVGQIVATPSALAFMDKHHIEPLDLLRRHQQCDWGDLDQHDRAANLAALKDGSRLLSSYEIGFQRHLGFVLRSVDFAFLGFTHGLGFPGFEVILNSCLKSGIHFSCSSAPS
ncbi:MAG: hypothetical protein IPN53_23505 [Comamonadaceae bacterium]|nr:hypothetical protein [Comamonadaceae bacterium]